MLDCLIETELLERPLVVLFGDYLSRLLVMVREEEEQRQQIPTTTVFNFLLLEAS